MLCFYVFLVGTVGHTHIDRIEFLSVFDYRWPLVDSEKIRL